MNLFSSLLYAAAALRLPKLLKDDHGGIVREFSEDEKFRFEGRLRLKCCLGRFSLTDF